MLTPDSQQFSYDIYPGLDDALVAALAQNTASGLADPGRIAAGLATAVGNAVRQTADLQLSPEAQAWGNQGINRALEKWRKYDGVLDTPKFRNSDGLYDSNPNLERTLMRLYDAQEQLSNSVYQTRSSEPIGETMKLVLMPWQLFQDRLQSHDVIRMLGQMRAEQGIDKDYVQENLRDAWNSDQPMYQLPSRPGDLISAFEYIHEKIKQDGPWGVMLAQTSDLAGTSADLGKSTAVLADAYSRDDVMDLQKLRVDQMGIFEWWALTFQEEPSRLSNSDFSCLLANRINVKGTDCYPRGFWSGYFVSLDMGNLDNHVMPRLAVL